MAIAPTTARSTTARLEPARKSAARRFYDAWWRRRRVVFLQQYPLCGMRPGGLAPVMSRCHDDEIVTAAEQVDHVVPHRGNRALFEDENNWQAMCHRCHSTKTASGG